MRNSLLSFEAPLNVTSTILGKLLLAPGTNTFIGLLRILIDTLLHHSSLVSIGINLLLGVLEAKAEVVLSKAGSCLSIERHSILDTLADDRLLRPLVSSELVIATHPYVLLALHGVVGLSSLPKLINALRLQVLVKRLIATLKVRLI